MAEHDSGAPAIDSNLFVTVSGPPGCGATALCTRLAEAMDCPYVSGGDIFRDLATDRDMTLTQLTAEAQKSDEIDRALDRRLLSIAEKWGATNRPFILESRLAGWLAGNRADVRIWLDAPESVRKERTDSREETAAEMSVREVNEAGRYQSYYDIDLDDRTFYDLQINTARWSKAGMLELVRAAIEAYDPDDDEGAFEADPIEITE